MRSGTAGYSAVQRSPPSFTRVKSSAPQTCGWGLPCSATWPPTHTHTGWVSHGSLSSGVTQAWLRHFLGQPMPLGKRSPSVSSVRKGWESGTAWGGPHRARGRHGVVCSLRVPAPSLKPYPPAQKLSEPHYFKNQRHFIFF